MRQFHFDAAECPAGIDQQTEGKASQSPVEPAAISIERQTRNQAQSGKK